MTTPYWDITDKFDDWVAEVKAAWPAKYDTAQREYERWRIPSKAAYDALALSDSESRYRFERWVAARNALCSFEPSDSWFETFDEWMAKPIHWPGG